LNRAKPPDFLQGAFDMLIPKSASLEPLHGYGVLFRSQQVSKERREIPL